MVCFECGNVAHHRHHPIPRVLGGKKTIPLCRECHGLIHKVSMECSELVKLGQAKARAEGKTWGRKRACDYALIYFLSHFKRMSLREISRHLGVPKSTAHAAVQKTKNKA